MMRNFMQATRSFSLLRQPRPLPAHAVQSPDPSCWEYLYKPEINLAICARNPPKELAEFAYRAAQCEFGLTLSLRDVRALDTHIQKSLRTLPGYRIWLDDIAHWIDAFQCLLGIETVGLRLCTANAPMCPRFHIDKIPARLITTYGVIGTQWLANNDVDRSKLGRRIDNRSDREAQLYKGEAAIRHLPAFSVALLKGESWEGNEGRGLVHRSPALSPPQRRLLLTLDVVN